MAHSPSDGGVKDDLVNNNGEKSLVTASSDKKAGSLPNGYSKQQSDLWYSRNSSYDDDDNAQLVIDEEAEISPRKTVNNNNSKETNQHYNFPLSVSSDYVTSNAIEKMLQMDSKFSPGQSLIKDNPSISQHLKQLPLVIEPQPMDDSYTSGQSNTSNTSANKTALSQNSTPVKRCAPVREAVDPAKYITVQEGDGIKYACSKCGNIYKWRKSLNKHWKEKHDGEVPEPRSNSLPNWSVPRVNSTPFRSSVSQVSPRNPHVPLKSSPTTNDAFLSPLGRNPFNSKNASKFISPGYSTSTPKPNAPSQDTQRMLDSLNMNQKFMEAYPEKAAVLEYLNKHIPIPVTRDNTTTKSSPPVAHSSHARYLPTRPDATVTSSAPHVAETQEILDLSRKRSPIITQPVSYDMPPQDEPLDFSIKKPKLAEKTRSSIENWNVPVVSERSAFTQIVKHHSPEKEVMKCEQPAKAIHCTLCTYVTRDEEDMSLHMRLHNTDEQFECAECQESLNSLDSLNQHFAVQHMYAISRYMNELRHQQQQQQQADGQQTDDQKLYRYLTVKDNDSMKACLVCGAVYQWQWALAKHFEHDHSMLPNPYQSGEDVEPTDSSENKPLKCSHCPFTADNLSDLTRHQIRHSLNKHHICKVCGYTARTKDDLNDHYCEDHPSVDQDELQSSTSSVNLPDEDTNHSDTPLLGPDGRPLPDLAGENIAIVIPQAPEDTANKSKAGRKPNTAGPSSVDVLLPYKCNSCEYRARWPSEITQHMKNHSDEKPFLCPRCTYRSKWKWDVVKHLKRCGGGTVKDVIDTTRMKKNHYHTSPKPENLSYGLGRELSNGPPNVTVLPGSADLSESQMSENSHQDGKLMTESLECNQCSYMASSNSEMKKHMKFHSYDAKQVYCNQCPFVGNNPAELKRHMRVHSDEKPFICKTCGYSSKWKCDLKKHCNTYDHTPAVSLSYGGHGRKPSKSDSNASYSDEHMDSNEEEETSDGGHEFRCQKCPFVSTSEGQYNAHMKVHINTGKSQFRCKQCDFEADDLSGFLQHKLTHTGGTQEINFNTNDQENNWENGDNEIRDICSSSSRRKQSKQTIMKTQVHSGNNGESQNVVLDNLSNDDLAHEMSENPQLSPNAKMYSCHFCPYVTHNRANYEHHMPHHEIPSKYSCEWCNWSSDRLNLLYRHVQVIHPGQVLEQEKEDFYAKVKDMTNMEHEGSPLPEDLSVTEAADLRALMPNSVVKRNNGFSEGKKTKRRLKTCPKCGYVTDNVTTLQRHMAKHGKPGKYTCHYCDYSVDKQHVIDYHVKLVHTKQLPNDGLMDDVMDNHSSSTVDFSDNGSIENGSVNSETIIDEDVNMDSADISTLHGEDVKIVHVGTRTVYGCMKCPYHTMKISGVLNHSKQHGQNKRYKCMFCDYSVDQSAHVKNHMKTVHGHNAQLNSPNDFVRRQFDMDDMDSTDIASNDNDSENQDYDSENEPPSKRQCLDSSNNLKQSMFKCHKCSFYTRDKNEWLKHKLSHLETSRLSPVTKSHLCDRCPYRTSNRSQLVAHRSRHGIPSKYNCPYCDYSCGNATQQANHVKLHFPSHADIDKNTLQQLIQGEEVMGFEPVLKHDLSVNAMSPLSYHSNSPKSDTTDINCNSSYGAK